MATLPGGEWICRGCGNRNYSYEPSFCITWQDMPNSFCCRSRVVCNMRKCGLPRDASSDRRAQFSPFVHPGLAPLCVTMPNAMPGVLTGFAPSRPPATPVNGMKIDNTKRGRLEEPGEKNWVCKLCRNVNYATRTHCNMRKCGAPRQEAEDRTAEEILLQQQSLVPSMYMYPFAAAYGYPTQQLAPAPLRGVAVSPRPQPGLENGNWRCEKCGNINYSSRTKCNMRKCGADRPLQIVQEGPAPVAVV